MSTKIPKTTTVVSYAYELEIDGETIGTLQGFNPSQTRELQRIRAIDFELFDDTFEIAPGRTDLTITVEKLEVYKESLLSYINSGVMPAEGIVQMIRPFNIIETIADPGNTKRPAKIVVYRDCWISNYSKSVKEGTITVLEQAQIMVRAITMAQMEISRSKESLRSAETRNER